MRLPSAGDTFLCRAQARGDLARRARRLAIERPAQLDEERRIIAAGGCVLYPEGRARVDVVYLRRAAAIDMAATLRTQARHATTVFADPATNGVVLAGEADEVNALMEEAMFLDCAAGRR